MPFLVQRLIPTRVRWNLMGRRLRIPRPRGELQPTWVLYKEVGGYRRCPAVYCGWALNDFGLFGWPRSVGRRLRIF